MNAQISPARSEPLALVGSGLHPATATAASLLYRVVSFWMLIAFGWLAVSALFSWYTVNFGSYNKTYGSLGAVVGFMTWIWLSVIVVLLGAELNAETERQAAAETAPGAAGG